MKKPIARTLLILSLSLFLTGCSAFGDFLNSALGLQRELREELEQTRLLLLLSLLPSPPNSTYTVGGTITGLTGSGLLLTNNGTDLLSPTLNNGFTFSTRLATGSLYNVQVSANPPTPGLVCTASNNTGKISTSNVTAVNIICSTVTYTVGGTVTGLTGAGLLLTNNGTDLLSPTANGSFTFATRLAKGSLYNVQVSANPATPGLLCTASNNTGKISTSNVTAVNIICSTVTYTVGGTVTGLTGSGLQLTNNGTDPLSPTADGGFTFSSGLTNGSLYNVQVSANPTGPVQICTASSNIGLVQNASVKGVKVVCSAVPAPTGVQVAASGDQATVSWNGAQGAASYNIYWGRAPGVTTATGTKITNATSPYTHTNLNLGAAYYYIVTAVHPGGESAPSSEVSVTPSGSICRNQGITIPCTSNIGGWVSGLQGEITITNTLNGDTVKTNVNGPFRFGTYVGAGLTSTVMVSVNAGGQSCRVDADNLGNANSNQHTLAAASFYGFAVVCGPVYLPVADTGQTKCWDSLGNAEPTCLQPISAGQDGAFTDLPLARSFTGPAQHPTYTADYTTRDNVTGLTWKSCSEGQSGANCQAGGGGVAPFGATAMTWINAGLACRNLNNANGGAGYAGTRDWRLPTVEELGSLPNYGGWNPAIDAANFPATPSAGTWSSTTYLETGLNSVAWGVHFSFGHVRATYIDVTIAPLAYKINSAYVRCVAGNLSRMPSAHFTDNGDGTVKDNVTHLTWQKCSAGQTGSNCQSNGTALNYFNAQSMTWDSALAYCNGLNLAGKIWRLPNINEWKSIIDRTKFDAVDPTLFPAPFPLSWSSTTAPLGSTTWVARFEYFGAVINYAKINMFPIARCVTGP